MQSGASFLDLIRSLIGRSVGRRVPQNLENEDSDDETGSTQIRQVGYLRDLPRPGGTRCDIDNLVPVPQICDTSAFTGSSLHNDLMYKQGKTTSNLNCINGSVQHIPRVLQYRSLGMMGKKSSISPGQRLNVASNFLPQTTNPKKVFEVDKFYCGIHNNRGDIFMAASQDSKIRLFDTSDGRFDLYKTIDGRNVGWAILDVQFAHQYNRIIYSSWSEYIHMCTQTAESDDQSHHSLRLCPETSRRVAVFSMCFSADDQEIIAGTNAGYIYTSNVERLQQTGKFDAHEDDLSCVCFSSPHSEILYSGGEDGLIKVWDRRLLNTHNPTPVMHLAGHRDSVVHIDPRGDDRHLISNSKDQTIKLWDIRKPASAEGVSATRTAVSKQSWDYRWHMCKKKALSRQKLAGDCSLMTYRGHIVLRTLIRSRFSPPDNTGQRYIYTGDGFGRVFIYDILTGQIVRKLEMKDSMREVIRDVHWHPTDNHIITSGWDLRLMKWTFDRDIVEDEDEERTGCSSSQ